MDCVFVLPEREGACTVTLYCDGQMIVSTKMVGPEENSVLFRVTGSGVKTYVLHIQFGGDKKDMEMQKVIDFNKE